MRRTLKITGLVVAAVAAGSLATGLAVASTTTTTITHPVTLCIHKNTVSYRAGSSCGAGATTILVASNSDLAALAARVDAIEANQSTDETNIGVLQTANTTLTNQIATANQTIDSLTSRVAALEATVNVLSAPTLTITAQPAEPGSYVVKVVGTHLKPDTQMDFHFQTLDGPGSSPNAAQVAADGSLDYTSTSVTCSQLWDVYATATSLTGNPVTSNTTADPKGPGCP